jgi:hypothetical protein
MPMQMRCLRMLTPDLATPFGAGFVCDAMRDKGFNYPGNFYAECCRRRAPILAQNPPNQFGFPPAISNFRIWV